MGKVKDDSSDNEMEIEEPVMKVKKNKKIVKATIPNKNKSLVSVKPQKKAIVKKNIIKQFAKQVNLKPESSSLQHKQELFQKIVTGLKNNNKQSKKDRKKNRILIKKEMNKALEHQKIKRKLSRDASEGGMEEEQRRMIHEPKKKKRVDDRKNISSFHQLMGAGLQNIRNMVANNISR